ncbi:MAG: hypothetical protein U0Q11_07175 [Vicinamibacterales bacterium]
MARTTEQNRVVITILPSSRARWRGCAMKRVLSAGVLLLVAAATVGPYGPPVAVRAPSEPLAAHDVRFPP